MLVINTKLVISSRKMSEYLETKQPSLGEPWTIKDVTKEINPLQTEWTLKYIKMCGIECQQSQRGNLYSWIIAL